MWLERMKTFLEMFSDFTIGSDLSEKKRNTRGRIQWGLHWEAGLYQKATGNKEGI